MRTLAYVVPLTLLVWVWAQDQQIDTRTYPNVAVNVAHADGDKVVTILRAGDGDAVRSQGQRLQIGLELQGPRVGLNAVVRALDEGRAQLDVRVQTEAAGETTIPLRTYLNSSPTLQEFGVSVAEVTPADLVVLVEPRREVTARLAPGGLNLEELTGAPVFDPATIQVSGPASAITQLRGADGEVTLPVALPEDAPPGEHQVTAEVQLPVAMRGRLQLDPPAVKVQFTRRERRLDRYTIPAVAVWKDVPGAMEQVITSVTEPVVNNVTVEGPADVIQRLRSGELADEVRAIVEFRREDLDLGEGQKRVRMQLPKDVVLVGEPPTVGFTIRRAGST